MEATKQGRQALSGAHTSENTTQVERGVVDPNLLPYPVTVLQNTKPHQRVNGIYKKFLVHPHPDNTDPKMPDLAKSPVE
jgi:hypothetical protein